MNNQEPLDRLADFYRSLDAIPTPSLPLRTQPRWGNWMLALSPFAAGLLSYVFISSCAVGLTSADPAPRTLSTLDRYALDEIRSLTPQKPPKTHTLSRIPARKMA